MKSKKYRPETDFEKETHANLIDKIRSIEEEKLSDDFDNKFFKELNAIPKRLLFDRVKYFLKGKYSDLVNTLPIRRPKLIYAVSFGAFIVMTIALLIFYKSYNNVKGINPLITTNQDTIKIKVPPLIPPNHKSEQNIADNRKYFDDLYHEINAIRSFNNKNYSREKVRKALQSGEFKNVIKTLSQNRQFTRSDTIEGLLQLLNNNK